LTERESNERIIQQLATLTSQFSKVQAQVEHIDKTLTGPPSLPERVSTLEAKHVLSASMQNQVQDNVVSSAVSVARQEEREHAEEKRRNENRELRQNIQVAIGVASLLGGLIATGASYFLNGGGL